MSEMSERINPLANPKGKKKLCEVCQRPACLQCAKCRVTFYCDPTHQQEDWDSLHEQICQLLIPIRTPAPFLMLQSDRDHHQTQTRRRKEQLIELSHSLAKRRVFEGSHQEALPAAQFSLRVAMDVYGPDPVRLVPGYLLLAAAHMGLGRLSQAQQVLSQAQWAVLKTPDCSRTILHQLHRSLGHLHAAAGHPEAALDHYANDVFYASEEFGLDSIITCGGYFLMANVFLQQDQTAVAHSLYAEVARTWHARLSELYEKHIQSPGEARQGFDEAQRAELDHALRAMLEVEERSLQGALQSPDARDAHAAQAATLAHCLAMLWALSGSRQTALEFGRRALELTQQGYGGMAEPIQKLLLQEERDQQPA